ncbi:unnamed protein product, partial [Nesidiocoris tenuis]
MASGVTKLSHSRRWRGCRGHAFVKRRRCYAPRKKEVAISLIRKETNGRTRTTSSYQYSLIISPNMICEYADSATGREVRLCCYPRMLPSFTEWLTMECSRKTIQKAVCPHFWDAFWDTEYRCSIHWVHDLLLLMVLSPWKRPGIAILTIDQIGYNNRNEEFRAKYFFNFSHNVTEIIKRDTSSPMIQLRRFGTDPLPRPDVSRTLILGSENFFENRAKKEPSAGEILKGFFKRKYCKAVTGSGGSTQVRKRMLTSIRNLLQSGMF